VSRDVAIGATLQQNVREWHLLSAREWLVLCKHCKLATSSFGRAELTRAFMQLAVDPKDGLGEPTLAFDEFVQVLVLVAFERVNPFAADWLLGHSADVPLVPLDEALAHFLSNHLLALSDAPDAAVAFRLITNEQVRAARVEPRVPLGRYATQPTHAPSAAHARGHRVRRLVARRSSRLSHSTGHCS
jgi:hypothetical protein